MRPLRLIYRALIASAITASLIGCGGVQPLIGGTHAIPESPGNTMPVDSSQLLYVTEYTQNAVLVYDAQSKNPKPRERITIGVNEPSGDCFDSGDVVRRQRSGLDLGIPKGQGAPFKNYQERFGESIILRGRR